MIEKLVPLLALGFDTAIGDPRSKYHPVVLIGNLISTLESFLLNTDSSPGRKYGAGTILVLLVLIAVFCGAWAAMALLRDLGSVAEALGGAFLLSFAITPRSLAEAGKEIKGYLDAGNLEQARYKVGWIVGRDTDNLSVSEATRATVETVAENIVDGIISPLFYFAIGGVPMAFLYRAVNTMDSMIGYKNSKYKEFGMVAARTDDVFNYVPARITGALLVIAAFLLKCNAARALKTIRQDAAKHPSPNSGIPEAAVAGALGVQLGGVNYYGGVPSDRARMGKPVNRLSPMHIARTIKMMYLVTIMFTLLVTALPFVETYWLGAIP